MADVRLPSLKITLISSAPSMTCLLVTMIPAGSMMNPEPYAFTRRGESPGLEGGRSFQTAMFTTAGVACRATMASPVSIERPNAGAPARTGAVSNSASTRISFRSIGIPPVSATLISGTGPGYVVARQPVMVVDYPHFVRHRIGPAPEHDGDVVGPGAGAKLRTMAPAWPSAISAAARRQDGGVSPRAANASTRRRGRPASRRVRPVRQDRLGPRCLHNRPHRHTASPVAP
ncbi:MAG: hypothetical protein WDN25_10265 [Acetobacteraceae bacterium]